MTTAEAIKLVNNARTPQELFNGNDHVARYRNLARLVHPDAVERSVRTLAEETFKRLTTLYAELQGKSVDSVSVTKIGKWLVSDPLAKGDICDLYYSEADGINSAVFKIVRSAKDNDLMDTEASVLKLIANAPTDNFTEYAPELLDSFKASNRRVNVLDVADGYYTLTDILSQHPGLEFRHFVWFVNRLLSVLGFIHRAGWIHGAIIPDHLLYHPITHGLVLVDWCYATEIGKPVKAVVKQPRIFYPKELFKKYPSSPATDIYMMAQVMTYAAENIPSPFTSIFDWCLAESPKARPQDAWDLQDVWQSVAEKVYGKPKYVPLALNPNS